MPVAPWRLLVLALLPLELLLLQLILAGADPGPAPLLELSLLWSLAVVSPLTVLLRKKGAARLILGCGVALLQAPLLIWLDGRAGQAAVVTPGTTAAGWRCCCRPGWCWRYCNCSSSGCCHQSRASPSGDRLRSHQIRPAQTSRATT